MHHLLLLLLRRLLHPRLLLLVPLLPCLIAEAWLQVTLNLMRLVSRI